MEKNINEFNTDSILIADLCQIRRKSSDQVGKDKYLKKVIVKLSKELYEINYVDIIDGKSYALWDAIDYDFASNNIDKLYLFHQVSLISIKEFKFKRTITADEIFKLYFSLNKITNSKTQRDIKNHSKLLENTIEKPKDIVLNKILSLKEEILDIKKIKFYDEELEMDYQLDDIETQDKLLEELCEISSYYIKQLIKSRGVLEESKNDIQLENMKSLAALELKIDRIKKGEIDHEEDFKKFEKTLRKQ